MFKNEFRNSIRFKFLSAISLALFISTILLSTVIAIKEREMLKDALTSKGQGLASYIAKLSVDPLIMKDSNQLDAMVNEANKDEEIVFIFIQDAEGNIITSQYSSINYRLRRFTAILAGLPKESELKDIIAHVKATAVITERSAPILTGADVIGKVTVGLSAHKLRHEILTTILFVVAFSLAIAFALGAVIFFLSTKLILNPVIELAQATNQLAQGDHLIKVETRASGEIQMLVDSFNRMAEDLWNRTRELIEAQEALVRKEKMAVLGQVAGSVGHELRNPLGVMSNAVFYLQTVLADADESVKEYLEIIKGEITGSERIITDLLDSVHTKLPSPAMVGVETLLSQALRKCAIPASVTVTLDLPSTLPPLWADPQQTHQVFQNLISNAVEAMPEGGALEIRAVENTPAGNIAVSVRDSGVGIAPEVLAKLFQPLFTTKARGIGLGLVVVKNLIQANGGTVEVQSKPGQGATFTVTLPVSVANG